MPTPRHPHPQPTTTPPSRAPRFHACSPRRATRYPRLATSLICLAALALTTGCGETSHTPTSASAPPAATTAPAASPTTTEGDKPSKAASSTPHPHHAPNAKAKGQVRAAFTSLANAKPQHKLSPAQHAALPATDIELTSPAIHPTGTEAKLDQENTCYGANRSPALHWKNIPPGTAELAIFILSTKPVNNKLFYNWAITGINPTLTTIQTGQTPPGTTTGRNSYGNNTYSICPPHNTHETYLITIYALPQKLPTTQGFNPNTLHTQAQQTTHHTGLIITTYQHT